MKKFEVEPILTIFCCNYSSKTMLSFYQKTKFKNTVEKNYLKEILYKFSVELFFNI